MIKSKCFQKDFIENDLDLSTKSIILPDQRERELSKQYLARDKHLSEFRTDEDKQLARENINAQEKGDYATKADLTDLAATYVTKTNAVGKKVSGGGEIFNDYINNRAPGINGHAEGERSQAAGIASHAEGDSTTASGVASHSEGSETITNGFASHAEGKTTKANKDYSHAEGSGTEANAIAAHVEGKTTIASGEASHAEGKGGQSKGNASHAEGENTTANGQASHAEGFATETKNMAEHAEGQYNISHTGTTSADKTIHSVGVGDNLYRRKNAIEIMQNGDMYILNIGGYDGTNPNSATPFHEAIYKLGIYYIPGDFDQLSSQKTPAGLLKILGPPEDLKNAIKTNKLIASTAYEMADSWYSLNIVLDASIYESGDRSTITLVTALVGGGFLTSIEIIESGNNYISATVQTVNLDVATDGGLKVDPAQGYSIKIDTITKGNVELSTGPNGLKANYSGSGGDMTNVAYYGQEETSVPQPDVITVDRATADGLGNVIPDTYVKKSDTVGQKYPNSTKGEIFNDYTNNKASGDYSHAEGGSNTASGAYSHAEGRGTTASGDESHAEGIGAEARGEASHSEGYLTISGGNHSHAEGEETETRSGASHAEGARTLSSGEAAHAEGYNTIASGNYSHAEGLSTQAYEEGEHAEGAYNKSYDSTDPSIRVIHSVGIGTSSTRKNAHEIKFNGDHYVYGIGGYDGTNPDTSKTLQEVVNPQSCSTAGRPTDAIIGYMTFDTNLGKPIWYKGGNVWVDAAGTTV